MSTIIMSQCWPLQGMSPAQKAVLVSLADMANDDGVCWPSIAHIAMRTCLSGRSVQAAIKWLTESGALTAQERVGRSTIYIVSPSNFIADPRNNCTPANVSPPQITAEPPQMPHPTPANASPTPANAAPITINNRNRTVKEPSTPAKLALPEWLAVESWAMWDRFRKQKGAKAWSLDAKQLSLRTLSQLRDEGHDPTAVIEQSIERGWTGLFPLKTQIATGASRHANFAKQDYHAGVAADGSF